MPVSRGCLATRDGHTCDNAAGNRKTCLRPWGRITLTKPSSTNYIGKESIYRLGPFQGPFTHILPDGVAVYVIGFLVLYTPQLLSRYLDT